HDVVSQRILQDRYELPPRVQSFADRDRGIDSLADLAERSIALRWHRLLEPVDLAGLLQRPAETDRGRNIEAAMRIDQDVNVRSSNLPDQSGEVGRFLLAPLRHLAVQIPVPMTHGSVIGRKWIELDAGVTGFNDGPDLLRDPFRIREVPLVRMRVKQDVLADW